MQGGVERNAQVLTHHPTAKAITLIDLMVLLQASLSCAVGAAAASVVAHARKLLPRHELVEH